MKKNLFLLTILFWFLATTYVSSQENVIIPLKKPTLNPELKEKKISLITMSIITVQLIKIFESRLPLF